MRRSVPSRRDRYDAFVTTDRELFLSQCKPRCGTRNPERMRLEHWEWMVRHGGDPFNVRLDLGLDCNYPRCSEEGACDRHEPDWCFQRFGMTRTGLSDGRIICVGGEHEDSYDPDFCIYNDVIVLRPAEGHAAVTLDSGSVEIYGYPKEVFAPTDFHSATLVGDRLIVIGRLGYDRGERLRGRTPVVALDLSSYGIVALPCSGEHPGWIYEHHAAFDPISHAITVRGGKMWCADDRKALRYRAAHRLHVGEMRWELISAAEECRGFVIEAVRTGSTFNGPKADDFKPASVPHTWLPPEDRGCDVYLLDVSGVRITFEVMYTTVRVTIEGTIPPVVREALLRDVLASLSLRDAEWEVRETDPDQEW